MNKGARSREECRKISGQFMEEIKEIKKDINEVKIDIAKLPELLIEKLDDRYVSKESFLPVKAIAYGLVGLFIAGIIAAILAPVLK